MYILIEISTSISVKDAVNVTFILYRSPMAITRFLIKFIVFFTRRHLHLINLRAG